MVYAVAWRNTIKRMPEERQRLRSVDSHGSIHHLTRHMMIVIAKPRIIPSDIRTHNPEFVSQLTKHKLHFTPLTHKAIVWIIHKYIYRYLYIMQVQHSNSHNTVLSGIHMKKL